MKKVNIFCYSFQKVKPIYYIDSLHIEWNIYLFIFYKIEDLNFTNEDILSSLFSWKCYDYGLQIMETQD